MAPWKAAMDFIWTDGNSLVLSGWEKRNKGVPLNSSSVSFFFLHMGTVKLQRSGLQQFPPNVTASAVSEATRSSEHKSTHILPLEPALRCLKCQGDCISLPARELFILVQQDNDSSLNETPPLNTRTVQFLRTKWDWQSGVHYTLSGNTIFAFLNSVCLLYTTKWKPNYTNGLRLYTISCSSRLWDSNSFLFINRVKVWLLVTYLQDYLIEKYTPGSTGWFDYILGSFSKEVDLLSEKLWKCMDFFVLF